MKEIILVENESKNFEDTMNADMKKALEHFEGELLKIRTGRAHTSLVEDVMVPCYGGAPMPLKNLAALSAPETRLIVIQPWDNSIIQAIEKALRTSDIGVNPTIDGNIIRIYLPEMSTKRRDELIKILQKKVEETKVAMRNIRKEYNNLIRDAKRDKTISENFFNRLSDILQNITDKWIAEVEKLSKKKEADLKRF